MTSNMAAAGDSIHPLSRNTLHTTAQLLPGKAFPVSTWSPRSGFGEPWDRSNRHGDWKSAIEEAVVSWNSPQPYHPAAIPFINHSLNHLFGGEGKWHDKFTHRDNTHIERRVGSGVVMARHKKDPQRLPDSFYDSSAL